MCLVTLREHRRSIGGRTPQSGRRRIHLHRRPSYAALALAAAAMALVFVRWPDNPDRARDEPAELIADANIVPDVVQLRTAAKSRLAREVSSGRRVFGSIEPSTRGPPRSPNSRPSPSTRS
jgi:hypothetical protein